MSSEDLYFRKVEGNIKNNMNGCAYEDERKMLMNAYLDIENSKTNNVITIKLPILKYSKNNYIVLDISEINEEEYKLLEDATDPALGYTDIELFFIDGDPLPNFGPDYKCKIEDNKLTLRYERNINKKNEVIKNDDWTLKYNEEFDKIGKIFLKSSANYLLVYYNEGLKFELLDETPNEDIFMTLYFDKGYNSIALFKKNIKDINGAIRDNIKYIDSYSEDENILNK